MSERIAKAIVEGAEKITRALDRIADATEKGNRQMIEMSESMTVMEQDIIDPEDMGYVTDGDVTFERPKSRSLRRKQ